MVRQFRRKSISMAYRFKLNTQAEKGFRRIAREQIALAIAELKAEGAPPVTAIHGSRKALKRLRALVDCVEPAIGAKAARKHDRALRDIARALAHRRDADVSLQTVALLEEHFGDEARQTLKPLRSYLAAHHSKSVERLDGAAIADISGMLAAAGTALGKQVWKGKGFAPVLRGLSRTYRLGRVAVDEAFASPTDERLHELRKDVQAHWRHMALISRAWPEAFAARVAAAHEISQMLGDDHDLAMLKAAAGALDRADRVVVVRLCKRRQKELRALAEPAARRLYAEPEKAFAERMAVYWTLGRKIAAGAEARAKVSSDTGET